MTFLFIVLILIAVGLYAVKEYYQVKLNMTPRTTSPRVARELVAMLAAPESEEDPGGRFLEMGSGYGSLVLTLARDLPAWQIDGLEENPTLWFISHMRSVGKNFGNYRFFRDDFLTFALRSYDVVFINQAERTLKAWESAIVRRMPPETVVITLNARLPRVKPSNTVTFEGNNTFYIYQKRSAAPAPQLEEQYKVDQVQPAFTVKGPTLSQAIGEQQPELPLDQVVDTVSPAAEPAAEPALVDSGATTDPQAR